MLACTSDGASDTGMQGELDAFIGGSKCFKDLPDPAALEHPWLLVLSHVAILFRTLMNEF